MSGFSTWPLRDMVFLVILIFNAGGFVWMTFNHLTHIKKALDEILERLGLLEQRVARMEGEIDSKLEKK